MYIPRKHFIFDLDGTLAYTADDMTSALNKALEYYGYGTVTTEILLQKINRGARELVRGCMPEEYRNDDPKIDMLLEKYSEKYAEEYLNTTHLYPGIAEGIGYIKERGGKICVLSNKQDQQAKEICSRLFPEGTFTCVLGYNGLFPHKPFPSSALYLAWLMDAKPAETVIVGDSDIDMMLADNAMMHKAGVGWGYRSKELLLNSGAEIILENGNDFMKLV